MRKRKAAPQLARDVDLAIKMQPVQPIIVEGAECEPACECAPTGLYWFDEFFGTFSSSAVYAYTEENNYYLLSSIEFEAKVLGNLCDEEVEWDIQYSNPFIENYPPLIRTIDHVLMISAKQNDYTPFVTEDVWDGVIEFRATVCGVTLGPILLTVVPYSESYGYAS